MMGKSLDWILGTKEILILQLVWSYYMSVPNLLADWLMTPKLL